MIYILVALSLLFIAIAFIVTENNAKYLLAGYNTLSAEEQKAFDIESYIPYFRKFHIFLGLSFLVLGLLLYYFMGEYAFGLFLTVYPILAYGYFTWNTRKYTKGSLKKQQTICLVILTVALIFVVALFGFGFKEDALVVGTNAIVLKGFYGEDIQKDEIEGVTLVANLPGIIMKVNGFALGEIRKGYFKTAEGKTIKLILNSSQENYILLTKKSGEAIYFSAKDIPNKKLYEELMEVVVQPDKAL